MRTMISPAIWLYEYRYRIPPCQTRCFRNARIRGHRDEVSAGRVHRRHADPMRIFRRVVRRGTTGHHPGVHREPAAPTATLHATGPVSANPALKDRARAGITRYRVR